MRQSGKTFRLVLRSLADASAGSDVFFLADTRGHLEVAEYFANRIVSCIGNVSITKNKIAFCDSGSLSFRTVYQFDDREHRNNVKVVCDY